MKIFNNLNELWNLCEEKIFDFFTWEIEARKLTVAVEKYVDGI